MRLVCNHNAPRLTIHIVSIRIFACCNPFLYLSIRPEHIAPVTQVPKHAVGRDDDLEEVRFRVRVRVRVGFGLGLESGLGLL